VSGSGRSTAQVIDVHHHFEPTGKNVDGTSWAIESAIEQMDRNAVRAAIGYSGPVFDRDARTGRTQARTMNEWSTAICAAHPGRFGLFASLPMNDVAGSLSEIAYAFDVLNADGIGLAPHYDGVYLGEARFRPIFEELHRRNAVVYVHPSGGSSCPAARPAAQDELISAPWIDFPTDTARTILSLWATGVTRELPGIRFLFCHGGGVMPILLGRIAGFSEWATVGPERLEALFPGGVYAEFAKLYFECAQAYAPETFAMLRTLLPATHLLYGSDFSYFKIAHSVKQFASLALPDDERRMIAGENAATLLPRWKR